MLFDLSRLHTGVRSAQPGDPADRQGRRCDPQLLRWQRQPVQGGAAQPVRPPGRQRRGVSVHLRPQGPCTYGGGAQRPCTPDQHLRQRRPAAPAAGRPPDRGGVYV